MKKVKDPALTVVSLCLSLGFNFLPLCLKAMTVVLAKADTGLAAFVRGVPHITHITVS